MMIPTCLLHHQSVTIWSDEATQVFWGKNIGKYLTYTFFAPAQHAIQKMKKNYIVGQDLISAWFSQFLAFFS
eukprot:12403212-Karenia_brevis.AAC.1